MNMKESEERDDFSSAWAECKELNILWGGRARGGRGIRRTAGFTKDVSVEAVSLSFEGKELLSDARLRFQPEHRYGIIGENGVGKIEINELIDQSFLGVISFNF